MSTKQVNINFDTFSKSMQRFVRNKAVSAGSTIVYKKEDKLIEENPATKTKTVIKKYPVINNH